MKKVTIDCWKCSGKGYIPGYAGIKKGICFNCEGSGKELISTKNGEISDPYKKERQIASLKAKMQTVEKKGKEIASKLNLDKEDYDKRLEYAKEKGKITNEVIEVLNSLYRFDELENEIEILRADWKELKTTLAELWEEK